MAPVHRRRFVDEWLSGIAETGADFGGDGGSYPECNLAQYPLNMGRKAVRRRGHLHD